MAFHFLWRLYQLRLFPVANRFMLPAISRAHPQFLYYLPLPKQSPYGSPAVPLTLAALKPLPILLSGLTCFPNRRSHQYLNHFRHYQPACPKITTNQKRILQNSFSILNSGCERSSQVWFKWIFWDRHHCSGLYPTVQGAGCLPEVWPLKYNHQAGTLNVAGNTTLAKCHHHFPGNNNRQCLTASQLVVSKNATLNFGYRKRVVWTHSSTTACFPLLLPQTLSSNLQISGILNASSTLTGRSFSFIQLFKLTLSTLADLFPHKLHLRFLIFSIYNGQLNASSTLLVGDKTNFYSNVGVGTSTPGALFAPVHGRMLYLAVIWM